jgi:quinol monooxygenase YgiN
MTMGTPVHVVVKVVARADALADIRAIVLTLAEKSRAETGCTSYEVIQNMAEPETFLLVEEWESIAALEAHNKTPHFHEAVAKSASFLAKPLEVGRYTAIG